MLRGTHLSPQHPSSTPDRLRGQADPVASSRGTSPTGALFSTSAPAWRSWGRTGPRCGCMCSRWGLAGPAPTMWPTGWVSPLWPLAASWPPGESPHAHPGQAGPPTGALSAGVGGGPGCLCCGRTGRAALQLQHWASRAPRPPSPSGDHRGDSRGAGWVWGGECGRVR